MVGDVGPKPVYIQAVFSCAGIGAYAAVAGFLSKHRHLFAVIKFTFPQVAPQGMDQVPAVDAQDVIVLVTFIPEADAAVCGQEGSGQCFPEQLVFRDQAGGDRDLTQHFSVLPHAHGLAVFIHDQAVMCIGDHRFQLPDGYIAFHILPVFLPPCADPGKTVFRFFQHHHSVGTAVQGTQYAACAVRRGKDVLMLQKADVHYGHRLHQAFPDIRSFFRQEKGGIGQGHRQFFRCICPYLQGKGKRLLRTVFYGEGQHIIPFRNGNASQRSVPGKDVRQIVRHFPAPGLYGHIRHIGF